jgi:aspartate 1-decarboxylase
MSIYREMCKSKIHGATVTQAELYYEGSITIDESLLEIADILPFEKVQVVNLNNGARFDTYAIPGERDSGVICLNGSAARLGAVGDQIIIISYAQYPEELAQNHKPKVLILDKDNKIKQIIYGTINEIAK